MFCRCSLFTFNGPLGDQNCLITYWTDLHQIFRTGTHMAGHDPTDHFAIAQGCNRFLRQSVENWHTPPSFCAPAFHSRQEKRNTDACVNTADYSPTFDKNSVDCGPVTAEFYRRVCVGRVTRWALPCIQLDTSWGVPL